MTRRPPASSLAVSERMKRVRTSRTKAEREVEKVLRRLGLRYSRNVRNLPGRPDFILTKFDVAVFVDGCFWHGCPRCFRGTRANRDWWDQKIRENRRRDKRNDRALRLMGYRTLHLWEHDDVRRIERRLTAASAK